MSATLTPDIAEVLHEAYARGWTEFARSWSISAHVNLLCTGDGPGSWFTNEGGRTLPEVLCDCRCEVLHGIRSAPVFRRGEILPSCEEWADLVRQIDTGCSRMHELNSVTVDRFRISVGMVRMTRISHTVSLAAQLPSGGLRSCLRVKLCLHSQFPRLHRAWIETRLKRALTRKGNDPEAGIRSLCQTEDQNLFEHATKIGVRDIEIVVVTSPVIETGNDLDFDYAVLDPISMRSIIQSAGRVRRHRPAVGDHPNVLILGRSPIAMQSGKLSRLGVETEPADETMVARVSLLECFEDRLLRDLAGDETFSHITAKTMISGEGNVPLRDAEACLRKRMISTDEAQPLGKYLLHLNARLNLTMTRSRKFRRSITRDILYLKIGDDLKDAGNCSPGGSSGYSVSWLRQWTAFPCRAMLMATRGLYPSAAMVWR